MIQTLCTSAHVDAVFEVDGRAVFEPVILWETYQDNSVPMAVVREPGRPQHLVAAQARDDFLGFYVPGATIQGTHDYFEAQAASRKVEREERRAKRRSRA